MNQSGWLGPVSHQVRHVGASPETIVGASSPIVAAAAGLSLVFLFAGTGALFGWVIGGTRRALLFGSLLGGAMSVPAIAWASEQREETPS